MNQPSMHPRDPEASRAPTTREVVHDLGTMLLRVLAAVDELERRVKTMQTPERRATWAIVGLLSAILVVLVVIAARLP